MKTLFTLFMMSMFFLIIQKGDAQRVYTSQEWHSSTEPAGEYNRTSSVTDASLNVYVLSNKLMSNNTTDVILTKYSKKGALLWQTTFNGAGNDNDYGVTLALNSSNDVYVAAAVTGTTSMDFGLIKYSDTGTLIWSSTWNSTNDGIDIPADIDIDTNGNIYLVGGTQASNLLSDYIVLKYNSSGVEQWDINYDYASLHDAATSIAVVDASTIIVTGASASSVSNWDYATLKINTPNGTLTSSYRTNVPGVGFDNALGICSDDNNNIYITGYTETNGEKDIQTLKLDDEFGLEWVVTYDNFGTLDDIGKSIVVDDNGNVYVTGSTETATGTDFITIKYNAQGIQQWKEFHGSTQDYDNAEAEKIAIADNGVIVAGTVVKDGVNSFMVVNYDENGILKFAEKFNSEHENETVEALSVDGEDVFVSGTSMNNGVPKPITVKYSIKEKIDNFALNSFGDPLYEQNDLLVRLDQSAIKHEVIDKVEYQFGKLEDFLEEDAVTDIRTTLTSVCGTNKCDVTVYKIFMKLPTTLTTTTSRLGESIPVPKFWATLLFEFPIGVDVTQAYDDLESIYPLIKYADLNYVTVATGDADDAEYPEQTSLHDVDGDEFINADINIEPAWDYETGKPFVKVGVFDTGIREDHVEFGGDEIEENKILGGWNYTENQPNSDNDGQLNPHGTLTAGILGAIRNNEPSYPSIAGIAGGDDPTGVTMEDAGVSLYNLKILGDPAGTINAASDAIITSCLEENDTFGFGLHITNHSWRISTGFDAYNNSNFNLLLEAAHFANRANVSFIAAVGNEGVIQPDSFNNPIPAELYDDWILCVGGTGKTGKYKRNDVASGGNIEWAANRSWHIDVAAPSIYTMIRTTGTTSNSSITAGAKTSAATPHVSGVAALLMSYLNEPFDDFQNLAPEDIEYIVQMTAKETNFTTFPGKDSLIGYGLLDAGKVLQAVDKDYFKVEHFSSQTTTSTLSHSLVSTGNVIHLTHTYVTDTDEWYPADTDYHVDMYKVNATVTHNLASTDTIVAYWPRHSASVGFREISGDSINPKENISISTLNNTSSNMSTYFYKVYDTNNNYLGWWPYDPNVIDADFDYTILYHDPLLVNSVEEENINMISFSVSPNPVNNNQTLSIQSKNGGNALIELYDVRGKVIKQIFSGQLYSGNKEINVSLKNIESGIYFYKLTMGDSVSEIKIIKQ